MLYPEIDPILVEIGPLAVRWYGLMYLLGFAGAWWLGRVRARRPGSVLNEQQLDDLIFYGARGVVLGGSSEEQAPRPGSDGCPSEGRGDSAGGVEVRRPGGACASGGF